MSAELFQRYSKFEDGLRDKFHAHSFFRSFHKLTPEQFFQYLLQIGLISEHFVKWYETAKLGMTEAASEVVRHILRDEIPQSNPTHQDNRLADLNLMGVSMEQVRNVKPTAATERTVKRLYELVRYPQKDYDLRVLVTLRVAGEVLVAEQYSHVVRFMRVRFGIKGSESRFYFPHWRHDLKGAELGGEPGHTDAFDKLLEEMLTDERKLEVTKDAAERAFEARLGIHDQFLRKPSRVILKTALATGVLAFTALLAPVVHERAARPSYREFLAELSPKARNFYLKCDRNLLSRIERNGEVRLLAKVFTFDSAHEVWGEGP